VREAHRNVRGGATVKWRTVVPLVLLALVAGLAGAAPPNVSGWAAGIDAVASAGAQGPASCPEASNPNEPLTVSVGEQFTIAVAANRTTGYSWQLAHPPDSSVVQPAGSSYVPPGVARPGAEGKECWTFNAVGPGVTQIGLDYLRPWERGVAPARSLTFNVIVRGEGPTPTPGAGGPSGFSAVRFVDTQRGWAGGPGTIVGTTDGGQTWRQQWSGADTIQSFALLSGDVAWAVGTRSLLGTSHGGQTWSLVAEPPQPLSRVTFVTRDLGWGVAAAASRGPRAGIPAGALVMTRDGGRTWTEVNIPGAVQTVCFVDATRGLAAGNAIIWRTADGGQSWAPAFTSPAANAEGGSNPRALAGFTAAVQCADGAVAWTLFTNPGAMMQIGYALYRSDDGGTSWTPAVQSGQFFPRTGAPSGPGWDQVRLAAVDASTAYLVGTCGPCSLPGSNEQGTVSVSSVGDGGSSLDNRPPVAGLTGSAVLSAAPIASFPTQERGWLVVPGDGPAIYATTDGGETWTRQQP